jgi:hypothetical protein
MGQVLGIQNPCLVALDTIVQDLRKTREDENFAQSDINVESSIVYLQRNDVRQQFLKIVCDHDIQDFKPVALQVLNVVFIEMHATSSDGKEHVINFWPCSDCACVSIEPAAHALSH